MLGLGILLSDFFRTQSPFGQVVLVVPSLISSSLRISWLFLGVMDC